LKTAKALDQSHLEMVKAFVEFAMEKMEEILLVDEIDLVDLIDGATLLQSQCARMVIMLEKKIRSIEIAKAQSGELTRDRAVAILEREFDKIKTSFKRRVAMKVLVDYDMAIAAYLYQDDWAALLGVDARTIRAYPAWTRIKDWRRQREGLKNAGSLQSDPHDEDE